MKLLQNYLPLPCHPTAAVPTMGTFTKVPRVLPPDPLKAPTKGVLTRVSDMLKHAWITFELKVTHTCTVHDALGSTVMWSESRPCCRYTPWFSPGGDGEGIGLGSNGSPAAEGQWCFPDRGGECFNQEVPDTAAPSGGLCLPPVGTGRSVSVSMPFISLRTIPEYRVFKRQFLYQMNPKWGMFC